jgi:predicted DNA binding CopG/RHH family protein
MTVDGFRLIIYNKINKRGDKMAVSEAHKKASYKYNASRDSITIRPERSKGAAIRAAAVASGKSLQNYILDALNAKMQQEGQPLEIDPAESGEEGGL